MLAAFYCWFSCAVWMQLPQMLCWLWLLWLKSAITRAFCARDGSAQLCTALKFYPFCFNISCHEQKTHTSVRLQHPVSLHPVFPLVKPALCETSFCFLHFWWKFQQFWNLQHTCILQFEVQYKRKRFINSVLVLGGLLIVCRAPRKLKQQQQILLLCLFAFLVCTQGSV